MPSYFIHRKIKKITYTQDIVFIANVANQQEATTKALEDHLNTSNGDYFASEENISSDKVEREIIGIAKVELA